MKDAVARICLLLASSSLGSDEIRQFCRWVESRGSRRAAFSVENLRKMAEHLNTAAMGLPDYGETASYSPTDDDLADKVMVLLLDETGLTRARAADLLRLELLRQAPPGMSIPELGRNSFSGWIERLSHQVPKSLLLHVATKIRNEMAHAPKTDWPLRKPEE